MIQRECYACGNHYDLTADDVDRAMGNHGVHDASSLLLCSEHRTGIKVGTKYGDWILKSAWNNETWDRANTKEVYEVKSLIRGNKYYRDAKKKRDRMMKRFFEHFKEKLQ